MQGQAAHRIWDAIYTQSCFTNRQDETCTERRIFYRLISGAILLAMNAENERNFSGCVHGAAVMKCRMFFWRWTTNKYFMC